MKILIVDTSKSGLKLNQREVMMKRIVWLILGLLALSWAERLELVGSIGLGGARDADAYVIQVVGNYAYVTGREWTGTDWSLCFKIVDVEEARHPAIVGSLTMPSLGVFVVDTAAFVAAGDSGLSVVNVARPESCFIIGRFDSIPVGCVFVIDTLAVTAGNNVLPIGVINVADPTKPTMIGSYPQRDHDLFIQWPLAFGGHGLILDLSDPTKPVCLDSTIGDSWDVWASDTLLFTSPLLNIYNIADPTKPKLLGYAGPEPEFYSYYHLWGSEHYVYMTAYHGYPGDPSYDGIVVYDVSDPTNPKCTAKYAIEYDEFYNDIFVVGSRVYALTGGTLLIFDHITGIKEEPKPIRVVSPWLKVFPNPSNTQFTIRYGLSEMSTVSLRIYDVAGRLVKRVSTEASSFGPGVYALQWNGRDNAGNQVSAGIYFLRLNIGGKQAITQKAVLLH